MSKLTRLTAAAAGYVLGTRAGRERYEQIAAGARTVMRNPKVQAARQQAQGVVAEQAATVTGAAAEKAKVTASSVADKVRRNNGGAHSAADSSWPADTSAPAS